jgi:hypothetical protein
MFAGGADITTYCILFNLCIYPDFFLKTLTDL